MGWLAAGLERLHMKSKTVYYCTECGYEAAQWAGRCASCGAWSTMEEAPVMASPAAASGKTRLSPRAGKPKLLNEIEHGGELRFSTGIGELDRVLGGGAVRGSLVLVGGSPGIGKSTLLLQLCANLPEGEKVLYVTGEESESQLAMRAKRLGVSGEGLYVLAETSLEEVIAQTDHLAPGALIIDSIQTLTSGDITSSPGSVSQVKNCTSELMRFSKTGGCTIFIVGHVNKEGAIAGPKVLEHMVDCVLYFTGDRNMSYRILRAEKNRFGSTNEIGVFEMHDAGLAEIPNPSETLLNGRPEHSPGTCVTCAIEGSRPILAEIQALAAPSGYNAARRNSNGLDYNRAMLLLAVLEKRANLRLSACDVYINVVGGLEISEPAADLAAVLAIASSFLDVPVSADTAAVGEVGLTGEVRAVSSLSQRLAEIRRLGFNKCVIPRVPQKSLSCPDGLELIRARNVGEAVAAVLGR